MSIRNSEIEFIRINGCRIAACAWNGYKARGRGLVCVLNNLDNDLRQVPLNFLSRLDASEVLEDWYGQKESKLVSDYDPEKEVVVCFIGKGADGGTDFRCYKIQKMPSPSSTAGIEWNPLA